MNYSVIIAAGGNGGRMGLSYNKMFYTLSNGHTILQTSVNLFKNDENCKQIIIATNPDDMHRLSNIHGGRIVIVNGGKTRQESVFNGLMAVNQAVVLVHDGARPWCTQEAIDDLLKAMRTEDAAILAVPEVETVKVVENGYITQTIARDHLMHAQTPQAFNTEILVKAHHKAISDHFNATDDAQLIERFTDVKIKIVEGNYSNIKITTMNDVSK
ncbi:MAG: 2-C-methyl-D-erythritol 4-phosphate cytidylyltransferase [Erysipelotrichaceae bacterium]|jgi:2-C-methyl-D-erythritol 4-phosphate cytidylyltransferase|nr:2-C-methyl-D-erythritol 4-phosphate cytidylyltransferase [Erysipelotrichaceae bacterium]